MINKNVILIQVTSSNRIGQPEIPYGLMQIANILKKFSYHIKLIDLLIEDDNTLLRMVKELNPSIIGFSGISTGYYKMLDIVPKIKKLLSKESILIAGGPLASMYEYLLEEKLVDFTFHGEAEINFYKFLNYLEGNERLEDIGGIAYLTNRIIVDENKDYHTQNKILTRTKPEQQIENLDINPFPDYSLIDLENYVYDVKDYVNSIKSYFGEEHPISKKHIQLVENNTSRYISIYSAKGCTHRCTFCYRHLKGVRRHSIDYFFEHLNEVKKYLKFDGVYIGDELFNNDLNWIDEFLKRLEESDIKFLRIAGMRADKISDELIAKLDKVNCIEINFGHESASNEVLKYFKKGVSKENNILVEKLCRKYNIFSTIQLVVGSPVETKETIFETLEFLEEVDSRVVSVNWIIPLPETPLWKQIINRQSMTDIKEYIKKVYYNGGHYSIGNFSQIEDNFHKLIGWICRRQTFLNRKNANVYISEEDNEYYMLNSQLNNKDAIEYLLNKSK